MVSQFQINSGRKRGEFYTSLNLLVLFKSRHFILLEVFNGEIFNPG